ncbi:MAG: peptide chain release factor 3, partial [Gammaproteobacteria bacterium]
WPIGMGKLFKGVFDLLHNRVHLYSPTHGGRIQTGEVIEGLDNHRLDELVGSQADELRDEIDLVKGASAPFDLEAYRRGEQTPVFFGSGVNNFGVRELLDAFVEWAPAPLPRETQTRTVEPAEEKFSGFVFKIQANMDPMHHDRVAFLRICSGRYQKGMRLYHVRLKRQVQISNAITFMAAEREHTDEAWPGDILGLHNHGTIQIGDAFTQGEELKFTGIPDFAPEMFRRIVLRDPLRVKALNKGVDQLSEEGAIRVFRPLFGNDIIIGAVGILQFDVVAHRLQHEYGVECSYENVQVATARWVRCADDKKFTEFRTKLNDNLALDSGGDLVYIAPTRVNLQLTQERWPDVEFLATREH